MNIDTRKIIYALYYPSFFVGILWFVKLIEFSLNLDFYAFGNYPLSLDHLYGIVLQPFIHEGISHLWSNTIPLFFLIWALFYFYGDISFKIFLAIWLGSGIFTWLIGRPSFHIGASGIVYGLAFFLFFSGVLRKMRPLMALSAIIALSYGSMVWSMLPIVQLLSPELSWEGHLSGAFIGTLLAVWYRKAPPQPEIQPVELPSEESTDEYWMTYNEEESPNEENPEEQR